MEETFGGEVITPHWHWTFLAFDGDPTRDTIPWGVDVSITGRYTEEDAMVMASSVIKREHYKLRRVYECTTCGFQESAAASLDSMTKGI